MTNQTSAHSRLRAATAEAHASLDTGLAASDLTSRPGYMRYLLMNAPCAWIEPALTAAGIRRLLPDWDIRQRRLAWAADLEDLSIPPQPQRSFVIEADAGTMLGWSYVLEGSRLGARLLLKTVEQSEDPDIRNATRFLRHGAGIDFWPSFKAVLSQIDGDRDATAKACTAATSAFESFKAALADQGDAASGPRTRAGLSLAAMTPGKEP